MSRLWCAICGTAVRRVPNNDSRDWLHVAVTTETRQATEPLAGFAGPPIFPTFEITAGSVWATNVIPAATAGPATGYYGHGVPATTGWWAPLVGHVHVPGRTLEVARMVPDCCGWPMRLTARGWCCRVNEACTAAAPLAA